MSYRDIRIQDAGLSIRSANCLMNTGCETMGDVERLTDWELLRQPNFGRVSLNEVRDWFRVRGSPNAILAPVKIVFSDDLALRDWFAGQALSGLLASGQGDPWGRMADLAYEAADAMMRKRDQ